MYTIVTGAAGFIGSRIVAGLNREGADAVIAVDNLEHADKFRNLTACEIEDYLDKREFMQRLEAGQFDGAVEAVLHQGACSDTMETDGRYMMDNNYAYSRRLLDWCQEEEIPMLYASSASVYGSGPVFREERKVRGAAEHLRLLEVSLRPMRASRVCRAATRRLPGFATSTCTARTRRTRDAWPRWRFTRSTSSRKAAR